MANLTQVVKDLYASFERQDWQGMVNSMTDDVVMTYEGPAEIPTAGVWRERQGFMSYIGRVAKYQSDSKLAMTEFFEKENAVVAMGRIQFTVRATGIQVDTPLVQHFLFRDGKISQIFQFANTGLIVEAIRGRAASTKASG